MLELSQTAERSLRTGLDESQRAISALLEACAEVRASAPPQAQAQLDLAIVRLNAIQRDLRSRALHPGGDALYVGLTVTQAALASLTESFGAMRHGLRQLMPITEPPQGWFVDASDEPVAGV
jgi:hypothetical protein